MMLIAWILVPPQCTHWNYEPDIAACTHNTLFDGEATLTDQCDGDNQAGLIDLVLPASKSWPNVIVSTRFGQ